MASAARGRIPPVVAAVMDRDRLVVPVAWFRAGSHMGRGRRLVGLGPVRRRWRLPVMTRRRRIVIPGIIVMHTACPQDEEPGEQDQGQDMQEPDKSGMCSHRHSLVAFRVASLTEEQKRPRAQKKGRPRRAVPEMRSVWGLFLHFGEVGVHHVVIVVALGGTGAGIGARTGLLGTAVGGLLLVELFGQLVGSLGQLFGGSLDGSGVIAFHGLAQGGDLAFHVALHSGVHLVAQVVQGLFGTVDQAVGVVAPFMGLLGTVWGVMDCFGAMSQQTSVTLQQLAPGVAGSLLTTVAGLLVAIPSVFGFNFLTTQIRKMGVEIENFATSLSDRIEIEFAANYQAETERRREVKPEKAAVDNRHFWADDGSVGKQATSANAFNAGAPAAATASDPGDKILDFSLDDDSEEISNFDEE